jgi:hypothetical protein
VNQPSEFEIAVDRTPAPPRELCDAEILADLLASHGVEPLAPLVLDVERFVARASYRLAGEAVRHWLLCLPRTSAAAAALRRVILNSRDESLRESGRCCRVSHVSIIRAEKRLAARLQVTKASHL